MTTKAGVLRSLHLENVEADAMLLPVEAVYPSATALQAEKKTEPARLANGASAGVPEQ